MIGRFIWLDFAEARGIGADQLLRDVVFTSEQAALLGAVFRPCSPEKESSAETIAVELVQRIRIHVENGPEQHHREDAEPDVQERGVYPDFARRSSIAVPEDLPEDRG